MGYFSQVMVKQRKELNFLLMVIPENKKCLFYKCFVSLRLKPINLFHDALEKGESASNYQI